MSTPAENWLFRHFGSGPIEKPIFCESAATRSPLLHCSRHCSPKRKPNAINAKSGLECPKSGRLPHSWPSAAAHDRPGQEYNTTMVSNGDAVRRERTSDLQLLVDSVPSLIHTGRPDGYLDFFNQPWLRYVGRPLEDLQGLEVDGVHSSRGCRRNRGKVARISGRRGIITPEMEFIALRESMQLDRLRRDPAYALLLRQHRGQPSAQNSQKRSPLSSCAQRWRRAAPSFRQISTILNSNR